MLVLLLQEGMQTKVELPTLLDDKALQIKSLVSEMSYGLTIEKAFTAPKIFQLKKNQGTTTTIAIICAILKAFCDSIKANRSMDSVDIVECAEAILTKYSHESVKDIVLALKEAKLKGMKFYNSVDIAVIFEILTEYFEKKSLWIERKNSLEKTSHGSECNESTSLMIALERSREEKEKQLAKEKRDFIRQKAQEKETARLNYLASQNEL